MTGQRSARFLARSPALAALAALALASGPLLALAACRDSSSTTAPPEPPSPGVASTAEIRWHDGGGPDFASGEHVVALPWDELADKAHPAVLQDPAGVRFAYPMRSGDLRVVYLVDANVYLGPHVKPPLDFAKVPDRDHALGVMFENALPSGRARLVADAKKAGGEAAVVQLLVSGAYVDGPEWDAAYGKLSPQGQTDVKAALAKLLDKGQPSAGLKRAVALVPLGDATKASSLAARVRELAQTMREPLGTAVLLRALAAMDKAQASAVGCDALAQLPLDPKVPQGTTPSEDAPGREALAEAALLAIAAQGSDCKDVAARLTGDAACQPSLRCGPNGPLDGRESTKQDEPLCTKEQLAGVVAKELQRNPVDVLKSGTRPSLFAYAALLGTGKVPPAFLQIHERRRYALVEPATPSCEDRGPVGTPCHCDEALLRDQTCRNPEAATVSVSVCRWDIDDKEKKLTNVVAAAPP